MTPAISEAASACMDAFITTELDFEGARQIGLGRLSAEVPRLGTRHRAFLSNLVPADVAQLGALIKRRIACGYVFYDLVLCRGKEPGDSRFSRKSLAGESLFERWVPRMYGPMVSHLGQPSEMQRELLGASGTEIDLMSFFARFGVGWGDADRAIAVGYFLAGVVLRVVEGLTEEDLNHSTYGDVAAWKGAYEQHEAASRAQSARVSPLDSADQRNGPPELAAACRDEKLKGADDESNSADINAFQRYQQVLAEYETCEPDLQRDLAESAIDWTVVCLARSQLERGGDFPNGYSEIKGLFFALVDQAYALTNDAKSRFTDDERQQMFRQGQNYVDMMQQAGPNGKPRIGNIMQEAGGRLVRRQLLFPFSDN